MKLDNLIKPKSSSDEKANKGKTKKDRKKKTRKKSSASKDKAKKKSSKLTKEERKKKRTERKAAKKEEDTSDETDDSSDSDDSSEKLLASKRSSVTQAISPILAPQAERVPTKKILPGALLKEVEQPPWYIAKILAEERPDLVKDDQIQLEKEELDLLEKHLKQKGELPKGEYIYANDNLDEDDRKFTRYEVLLKYNEGRYSSIYVVAKNVCVKNNEKIDNNPMILKTGLRKNSATMRLKIKRELKVLQDLSKEKCTFMPNVVDSGKVCDMTFIVMNLLDVNLERLREDMHGKLKIQSVYHIAMETIAAISGLHQRNYVHRDIKPANFCIGIGAAASRIYLIDFGDTVKTGKRIKYSVPDAYSLPYWSIENHRRGPAKERSDIEAWFYMILEFFNPAALFWKTEYNEAELEKAKIKFWAEYTTYLAEYPPQMKAIADVLNSATPADSGRIRRILKDGFDSLPMRGQFRCDWVKPPPSNAIASSSNNSKVKKIT